MSQRNPVEMRECLICAESKPHPRKFPAFSSCDHDANTCVDCYVQQAVVVVEQHHRWNAVTCPACNVAPPAGDLELILPRHEFRRLDDLVKKAALMQDPNWRWCLASGCSYGQIHNVTGGSRLIKCAKCNAKSCFHHQVTWHLGYTCDEYDESHPLSIVTKTDEETIKRITKSCPNCKWRIQKEGGCSHMVCPKCNCTFFWNRLAFDGETEATSAEYAGGPIANFPGLDEDVENAIMRIEGFTNVAPRPAPPTFTRRPRIFTPTPTIVNQRPVTGVLRLPAAPAPPQVDMLSRSTLLAWPTTIRRGAVDLSAAGGLRAHRDASGARPVGLRSSPQLQTSAGDLDEQVRLSGEGMRNVSSDRTGMEEGREGRLRRVVESELEQSHDEMTDDDAMLNDPFAGYERRHEQQSAEGEAVSMWPPRFDSMEYRNSPFTIRPSAMRFNRESEPSRSITGNSHSTQQPRLPAGGAQYPPRYVDAHILEMENLERRNDDFAGMTTFNNASFAQRMMEREEADARRLFGQRVTATGQIADTPPQNRRRAPGINTNPNESSEPGVSLIEDEPGPVLPREWMVAAERPKARLPNFRW